MCLLRFIIPMRMEERSRLLHQFLRLEDEDSVFNINKGSVLIVHKQR
jgi:hypothetical protein